MTPTDILIITSFEDFDAARSALRASRWQRHDGGNTPPHLRAEVETDDGRVMSVALARPTRPGGRSTGPLATTLARELGPTCLAMCGVCAGNPEITAPGDVVVAEVAYEWDEGVRFSGGFIGDHRQIPLDPTTLRAAQ